MARVYLGLGANIGNREANLRLALHMLAERCRVMAVSSLYRSEAVVPEGSPPGPDYLNAVCAVDTVLAPEELLAFAKEIEHAIGRRPAERWAPRPIDIDILLYDGVVLETADLTVPHPRIADRNFVLVPLAEIAGEVVHGVEKRTIAKLASAIDDAGLERIKGSEWADSA
jgi:2-amino-4-hydroxy-6-hydroxymethyldihydropteridine diphosphokinase